ncbi:hypothetical protein MTO96_041163 [Rhipicephalus appendiculatus]
MVASPAEPPLGQNPLSARQPLGLRDALDDDEASVDVVDGAVGEDPDHEEKDESAESSNMEEEEESEAGDTEPDTEELALLDEQLERRGGTVEQWGWAGWPRRLAAGQPGPPASAVGPAPERPRWPFACHLFRVGFLGRDGRPSVADLLGSLQDNQNQAGLGLPKMLEVSYQDTLNMQAYLDFHLKPTWDWLVAVMDSTEAQLRFGCALSNHSDPSSTLAPPRARRGLFEDRLVAAGSLDGRRRNRLTTYVSADDFVEANCNVQAVASLADEDIELRSQGPRMPSPTAQVATKIVRTRRRATRAYFAAEVAAAFALIRRCCGDMEGTGLCTSGQPG